MQLKMYVDEILYKGHLYMMGLNAEKLFDMVRAYKKKCVEETKNIVEHGIVSDAEAFIAAANSVHNPRKFVAFNQRNLELLVKNREMRKKSGKSSESRSRQREHLIQQESSDNLIKVLCNKAMLEPFGQEPMEVESTKIWK